MLLLRKTCDLRYFDLKLIQVGMLGGWVGLTIFMPGSWTVGQSVNRRYYGWSLGEGGMWRRSSAGGRKSSSNLGSSLLRSFDR